MDDIIKIGDELICSVCGEIFKATNDTKYIINGGYTCSWKCFLEEAKRRHKNRADNEELPQRKRKCK